LDSFRKVGVLFVAAQIREWKNGNAFSGIDADALSARAADVCGTSREDVRACLSKASAANTTPVPIKIPMIQRLTQIPGEAAAPRFLLVTNFVGAAGLPNSSA